MKNKKKRSNALDWRHASFGSDDAYGVVRSTRWAEPCMVSQHSSTSDCCTFCPMPCNHSLGVAHDSVVNGACRNRPVWACLLQAPKVTRHVLTHHGGWTSLNVRAVETLTKRRTEQLWHEVLPCISEHGLDPMPAQLQDFFTALASSSSFRQCWTGQTRTPFILPAPFVEGLLSLSDILEGLAAPCRTCEAALTLTDGGDFRCPISLPPIDSLDDLLEVLRFGTVFLNTAGLHWKRAAEICLAASSAFLFPTNVNMYITGPERMTSTDVHTDNHDVIILQTAGAKHWRIFAPPPANSQSHPLYRGKHGDKLSPHELGNPLLDVVLHAGEVLFVPMGFAHFTSTQGTGHAGVSVHLTLGLSTADYNFCLDGLRTILLQQMGRPSDKAETSSQLWWHLLSPVPVGYLAPSRLRCPSACPEYLQHLTTLLAPTVMARLEGSDFAERPDVQAGVSKLLEQQVESLRMQAEAYAEVVAGSGNAFYAAGPSETRSQYRQSMLLHQLAENKRKRDATQAGDLRFVKRIDPQDGAAKTLADVRQSYADAGLSSGAADRYWLSCCESIYPNDRVPEDLINELVAASEKCGALLKFLKRRTPHLQSDIAVESNELAARCVGCSVQGL